VYQQHGIVSAVFLEGHFDSLAAGGGDVLADKISLDGQFAMTAIHEHGELNPVRTAEIHERIHGGTRGASAGQYVIDEDDRFARHIEGNDGGMNLGRGVLIQVVAVHVDVDLAEGDGVPPDRFKDPGEAFREMDATRLDAGEHDRFAIVIALGDFVGNAGDDAMDIERVEEGSRILHNAGGGIGKCR
jgi:hypothetical protein